MIDAMDKTLSVSQQCELLLLNRSSYYYKPKGADRSDVAIMRSIDETYTCHPYYGTRRMSKHLQSQGYNIGRKALRRYYGMMGLQAIYPKMNLSKRNQAHKVYPYLLNNVDVIRVNQVWSADITYVRLENGFVYLVAIIDWYSRYVLSWRISITLESEFCVSALEEAIEKYGTPEIFNTDQGAQFTSEDFTSTLSQYNIKISVLTTVSEARYAINEYMNFYNGKRIHQSLGCSTPEMVYLKKKILVH